MSLQAVWPCAYAGRVRTLGVAAQPLLAAAPLPTSEPLCCARFPSSPLASVQNTVDTAPACALQSTLVQLSHFVRPAHSNLAQPRLQSCGRRDMFAPPGLGVAPAAGRTTWSPGSLSCSEATTLDPLCSAPLGQLAHCFCSKHSLRSPWASAAASIAWCRWPRADGLVPCCTAVLDCGAGPCQQVAPPPCSCLYPFLLRAHSTAKRNPAAC
jgi:hypothetical protein